jgi:hypothetical protein
VWPHFHARRARARAQRGRPWAARSMYMCTQPWPHHDIAIRMLAPAARHCTAVLAMGLRPPCVHMRICCPPTSRTQPGRLEQQPCVPHPKLEYVCMHVHHNCCARLRGAPATLGSEARPYEHPFMRRCDCAQLSAPGICTALVSVSDSDRDCIHGSLVLTRDSSGTNTSQQLATPAAGMQWLQVR